MLKSFVICLGMLPLMTTPIFAGDLEHAPPAFSFRESNAVPVDFQKVDLYWNFSEDAGAVAKAVVEFDMESDGYPMWDMVPQPLSVRVNGQELSQSQYSRISDPHSVTKIRVLGVELSAGQRHTMEVSYKVPGVSISRDDVRAGFWMSDLAVGGGEFWEQFGPANYEHDQFKQTLHLSLDGIGAEHEVFTNGKVQTDGSNAWYIDFPDYFTSSSFYLHIAKKGRFTKHQAVYNGLVRDIPVLTYASSDYAASTALNKSLKYLAELEQTYGPYAHESLVAYIAGSGGMEYCGATMTSLTALGHEITHSWFARGVMPSSGNSGWIDEAVASWRDNGYPTAGGNPSGSSINLGGFSPYRRHTTRAAYTSGARLLSGFDRMFRTFSYEGIDGMRGVLRAVFQRYQKQTITVPKFKKELESLTGKNLQRVFDRYVYGKNNQNSFAMQPLNLDRGFRVDTKIRSHHPRPYTKAERLMYR